MDQLAFEDENQTALDGTQVWKALVERENSDDGDRGESRHGLRHGRSERYFAVHFDDPTAQPGDFVRVRVESVTMTQTVGARAGRIG